MIPRQPVATGIGLGMRALWITLGATLSLSGVSFFRYHASWLGASIDIPLFVLIALSGLVAAQALRRNEAFHLQRPGRLTWVIIGLACALCLWHLAAVSWSPHTRLAARETVKVGVGCWVLALAVAVMPRRQMPERFWTAAVWGGAALCAWLIYRSAAIQLELLSTDLEPHLDTPFQVNYGRNQFGGMLAYLLPFAAAYAWATGQTVWRYLRYLPLAVLGLAMIYTGSRGGAIATAAGLAIVMASELRASGWRAPVRRAALAAVLMASVVTGFVLVSGINPTKVARRWYYFYDTASVPELHSMESRSARTMLAIQMAIERPITGWGIGETQAVMTTLPHNDYATMVAELGIVGESLLLGILGLVTWSLFRAPAGAGRGWVYFGSRGAFVSVSVFMLTMDRVYSTTAFWILLALAVVAADRATHSSDGNQDRAPNEAAAD